jgi:hypothetical protein
VSSVAQLRAVAAAMDVAARREDATVQERADLAGPAAVVRLAAAGITNPDELRAASRAARAAVLADAKPAA